MSISNNLRDLNRLREILIVFFEEGLGHYVLKAKLWPHLPFRQKIQFPSPLSDTREIALHLRHAFERLGPTFVKLGQLLSVRPDLVPKEVSEELAKLQDQVPPFSFAEAQRVVQEDLGKPLAQLFKAFEETPLAAASMAQVHRAVLNSGKEVAVKIQRPGIKDRIDADLEILFHIAYSLEKHFPEARKFRIVEVVKEFALWTRRELNFEIEARSAQRLREELKGNKHVLVPKIYPEYSSKRVMVQDLAIGIKIDDFEALRRYNINRKTLTMNYCLTILEQALLHGFFHADPHPANIFVDTHGRLIFLDYGIMGELGAADRTKVIRIIASIPEKDADKTMDLIVSLARDTSQANIPEFKREAFVVLEDVYLHTIGQRSMGSALYEVLSIGAKYDLLFDPNHILMAKSLYQAEGLGLKLYPEFKLSDGFKIFAEEYLDQKYSPRTIIKTAAANLWKHRELLEDLPDHLAKIIEHLEKPEAPHLLEISQLRELESEFASANKRKSMGAIIAALILGSALLFYLEGRTQLWGIPLSVGMLALGLVLLVILFLFYK